MRSEIDDRCEFTRELSILSDGTISALDDPLSSN